MIDSAKTGVDGRTWEDGLVGVASICRWTSSDRRLSLPLRSVKEVEEDLPRPPIETKSAWPEVSDYEFRMETDPKSRPSSVVRAKHDSRVL